MNRNISTGFKHGNIVISRLATSESEQRIFVRHAATKGYAFVQSGGTEVQVPLSNLMHLEDWKTMRIEQAKLKNAWGVA